MLAGVPADVAQVVLRPKESLPVWDSDAAGHPFWENPYFQDRQPLARRMLDPVSGQTQDIDSFLGHTLGKSIIRTSVAAQALNPHRWTAAQSLHPGEAPLYFPLPKTNRGWHYHYAVVSPDPWLKKFSRESRLSLQWEDGRDVEFPKGAWRVAAARMGPEEAAAYLREWVFVSAAEAERLAREGRVVKENYVAKILDSVCHIRETRGGR
jgi:hypothetical protein